MGEEYVRRVLEWLRADAAVPMPREEPGEAWPEVVIPEPRVSPERR